MKGLIYLPKIKINYSLKTDNELIEKNLYGIYHDNTIIFKDSGITTSILLNDKILKRENNDYSIMINFNDISFKYYLKENNSYLNFDIILNDYYISDDKVYINYDIVYDDTNKINIEFNLNYEVIKC